MRGASLRRYLLSVPERIVRSASAVSGGLLRELGDATLPPAIRRTRLYRSLADSTLRFLIEQVGQVEGAYPPEGKLAENFAIRRTAGNGIEMIGILTFRASPVWVMAALADISGASRHIVREVAAALKQEGLLEPGSSFETVDQILDGLERTAGRVAEAINTPPLDVAELRSEWAALREEAGRIPRPQLPSNELLAANWEALKREAAAQNRTVFELSTLMALAAVSSVPENLRWLSRAAALSVRRTGSMLAEALLAHYNQTLAAIRAEGYLGYWVKQFRPYLRAAAAQFLPSRRSSTERWLG